MLGAVISQKAEDGKLHPIAFHSRKFQPAEINYKIYDKEMLSVVEGLERHRHYFEGLGHQTTIYSDHLNLLWFTETKVYNRRQVRWAEKLSKYDFKIVFRPGRKSGKPDALSRRPDYTESASEGKPFAVLKEGQIDTSALDPECQTYLAARSIRMPMETASTLSKEIKEAVERDPEVVPFLPYL